MFKDSSIIKQFESVLVYTEKDCPDQSTFQLELYQEGSKIASIPKDLLQFSPNDASLVIGSRQRAFVGNYTLIVSEFTL